MELLLLFLLIIFIFSAAAEMVFALLPLRCRGTRPALVIPITENMQDAELVLRRSLSMVKGSGLDCRIILCNMGADSETLEICRIFADGNDIFELCPEEKCRELFM